MCKVLLKQYLELLAIQYIIPFLSYVLVMLQQKSAKQYFVLQEYSILSLRCRQGHSKNHLAYTRYSMHAPFLTLCESNVALAQHVAYTRYLMNTCCLYSCVSNVFTRMLPGIYKVLHACLFHSTYARIIFDQNNSWHTIVN